MTKLVVLVGAMLLASAGAATADQTGSSVMFKLVGSAESIEDGIRLTSDFGQLGAAWSTNRVSVGDGFDLTFRFRIYDLRFGGADGFAVVIQNEERQILSGGGGTFGYLGVPSVAIEFDTWMNLASDGGFGPLGDPDDNHISVHTNGQAGNGPDESFSIGATSSIPNLSDGNVHLARISYRPGELTIFLDDLSSPVLAVALDLGSTLVLAPGGKGWVGMVGATGGAAQTQDILEPEVDFD